jgi:hypothetical protein
MPTTRKARAAVLRGDGHVLNGFAPTLGPSRVKNSAICCEEDPSRQLKPPLRQRAVQADADSVAACDLRWGERDVMRTTHRFALDDIEEAFDRFSHQRDGVP